MSLFLHALRTYSGQLHFRQDIAGMALVIFGLLSIGVFGAVLGILAIAVIIKFVEVYTIPLAVVLGLVGIGIFIFGLKGT